MDFLDYLHHLETMNIEVASDFILVAAKLMRIKAKMLLPRPQLDEEGNEIDPRDELVKHLLEYKRYKSVLNELMDLEDEQLTREKRGNIDRELKKLSETVDVESELQNVDLYKLLNVYRKVLQRWEIEQSKPKHTIQQYPYTIEKQKAFVLEKLGDKERLTFEDIISYMPSKMAIIYNFLSILELLQLRIITMHLGIGYNNFWIEKLQEEPAV